MFSKKVLAFFVFLAVTLSGQAFASFQDFRYECRGERISHGKSILYDFDLRARLYENGRFELLNRGDFTIARRGEHGLEYFVRDGKASYDGFSQGTLNFTFPRSKFGLKYRMSETRRNGTFEHRLSRNGKWERISSRCVRFARDW